MPKHKLKQALERVKGVDHHLEKQKQLRKAAEKKKRAKDAEKATLEVQEVEEVNGSANELVGNTVEGSSGGEDSAESNDGEEEQGGVVFDLERIDDSDSSSDGEENLTEAVIPRASKPSTNGKGKSKKTSAPIDEDSVGEDEDEEDIPLSDIESLNSEDKGDVTPYQRLTINNISALQAAHKRIALPLSKLDFSVHQSVTTLEPVKIEDIDDDLNRELAFYAQSLSAVKEARKLLKAEGNPFTRPVDYFAEMVKSDEHMGRVKAKLIDEAAGKKAAAEARKQRDLKKFGKQVQVAKGQERDKAKRETLEKIKVLKRKRGDTLPTAEREPDLFDVELEDAAVTEKKDREARRAGASGGRGGRGEAGPNKRRKKDEKYGFGGKKRFGKSGDAESSADMSGFSVKKMKGGAFGGGSNGGRGGKGGQRPGKDRRAKGRA